MVLLLTALSGIAWTIVYLDSIRVGFSQKTYAMPIAALGLNIAWGGRQRERGRRRRDEHLQHRERR